MKSTKERSEKNVLQVTFDPVSIGFRHVNRFIKQPVAQASINSDPLTPRVPVNGAKSDRMLEGEFFDHSKLYLICATHGATYEPDSGYCVLGPCRGKSLVALPVEERGGVVILVTESETNHV